MKSREHLAIIGSGASAIYLLKHLLDAAPVLQPTLGAISIFEKSGIMGMGMPYNPQTTDRFNLSNISSQELPDLPVTLGDWLRLQTPEKRRDLGVGEKPVDDGEVYSRLALGQYLHAQYEELLTRLKAAGIDVHEHPGCEVVDIEDLPARNKVCLKTADGESFEFNRTIIATGHCWPKVDHPKAGFFASPWPISKILPGEGEFHPFTIGTLGASLSAFDVVTSLAHRHGEFVKEDGTLRFHAFPGAGDFKIVMHSGHGMLPHLQFEQVEPYREIYRHVNREGMLALLDARSFLRLDTYFDKVCRPALQRAFELDSRDDMVAQLAQPTFGLGDFVDAMSREHDHSDPFEGMRQEMPEARASVRNHRPVHWKEVIDDLMYTLNFHAEYLPAEDHLFLHSRVMPFLMNVIAAMPLPSGDTILALHDAGRLDLVSGRVSVTAHDPEKGKTSITVEKDGDETSTDYRMFIDCSGQKALEMDDYPFPSLVTNGTVRRARAVFANPDQANALVPESKQDRLFHEGSTLCYHTGGIDIDGACRVQGKDGKPNRRIHDISFPHTTGVRPYSYGLQACSDTSAVLVKAWVDETQTASPVEDEPEEITKIYEAVVADHMA